LASQTVFTWPVASSSPASGRSSVAMEHLLVPGGRVGPAGPSSRLAYATAMARTQPRAPAEELTEADLAILHGRSFAHLTTVGADGSPQATPTWVDVDDEGRVL